MTTQNLTTLLNLASSRKSTFGLTLEVETKARLGKGAAERIFGNRDAVVIKHSVIHNAFVGRNYQNNVEAHAERNGGGDFQSTKPKGMHWKQFPFILVSDTDPSKLYLRIGISPRVTHVETFYIVDGRIASSAETAEIEAALPQASYNRQYEAGVAVGDEVIVKNYSVDSILHANAWGIAL